MATARIRELFKKYGLIATGVHLTVYGAGFAGCYAAIEYKFGVEQFLESHGLLPARVDGTEDVNAGWLSKVLAGTGSLGLAFLCNKALFPVRAPITLGLTPFVARFLGRAKKAVP